MMTVDEKYDFLHDVLGISVEALDLAFGLCGYLSSTADDILYWKTGYANIEEYIEEMEEEEEQE